MLLKSSSEEIYWTGESNVSIDWIGSTFAWYVHYSTVHSWKVVEVCIYIYMYLVLTLCIVCGKKQNKAKQKSERKKKEYI